ncbi:MAG: S8 family peptidase [Xanthomonadaceae bacterium]|nr:S8 family peptidase [Xanthomonadaceae bacterium]
MRHKKAALCIAIAAATLAAPVFSAELRTTQRAIKGQYIVVLKSSAASLAGERSQASRVADVAARISTEHKADLLRSYQNALRGFAVRADDAALTKLLADPRVAYVEQDGIAMPNLVQIGPTWGIDRIAQRYRPLNSTYTYDFTGAGVHAYIIDSGLKQTHNEFSGRVGVGADFIGGGVNDCNGHGTHVTGTIAGTTWGVAKLATVHPVRVFGCDNYGSPWSTIIAGIDWVAANRQLPAVANMSLGGAANSSVDAAVDNLINRGVTVVTSAGNDSADACSNSPAHVRRAITVGATDRNDNRSWFSNYGTCVDLFAPGSSITSAWYTSNSVAAIMNGTSMAAPHVAGVAALYLQSNPGASPAMVVAEVVGKSTANVVGNPGPGSPNLFVFSRLSTTARGAFFRYYNAGNGDHFYTMDWNELNAGGFGNWTYEGVQAYTRATAAAGTVPLYRYFNTGNGDHFYTTNFGELGGGGGGWIYEGVRTYVPKTAATDTAPLYRYYNTGNGDYFYTTNYGELGRGGGSWIYQGVQSQVWTQP